MRGVRIPHELNGQDRFLLGLSVTNLGVVLFGLLAAWAVLHLGAPLALRIVAGALIAGSAAALAWIRPEGRSLVHWLLAAIAFLSSRPSEPATTAAPAGRRAASHGPQLSVVSQAMGASAQRAGISDEEIVELPGPARAGGSSGATDEPPHPGPTPVYLGGPQIITFFSLKGGTGKTTLATETACLLASKGWYRDSSRGRPQPLKVLLADFDLASANVSIRTGLVQPTILDYLADAAGGAASVTDYLLRHEPSGLHLLLGSPKCLTATRSPALEPARVEQILTSLKTAGYHFIFIDIGPLHGDVERSLLETADRVYCVVTPAAAAIQDLYRGVEALRRLGLGPRLRFVANMIRERRDLSEPMGDLGGTLEALIPYDAAFEQAENRHRPFAIEGKGETQQALCQLAASVYPGLGLPEISRTSLPWDRFWRRRHAG